ncbi:MAG TPA: protein-L-isoaspartate O-methyltransferase [Steroidobacter sp.]
MSLEVAARMIDSQVRTWEVFDEQVLEAMRQVPRDRFVPAEHAALAYVDAPIPLGHGQTMLPAKIHGRILQALALEPADLVLEIGAGSGYLTACLARLAARVRSLEIHPDLAQLARSNLLAAAINNAAVEVADGMQLAEQGVYDAIAVTGSLPIYDERFQQALKIGGRLFVIVGEAPVMEAWKVTRIGEREWQREGLFETVVEPLVNAPRPSPFVF